MFDRSLSKVPALAVVSVSLALGVSACGSSQAPPATGTVITRTVPAPVAQAQTAPPQTTPAPAPAPAERQPEPAAPAPAETAPAEAPAPAEDASDGAAGGATAAYVTQAEAICADVNGRLGELGRNADFAAAAEQSIAITRDGAQRLRALAVPASAAADHGRFVALLEQQTGALEKLRQAYVKRDDAALRAAAEASQTASALQTDYARRLGLRACASATSRGG